MYKFEIVYTKCALMTANRWNGYSFEAGIHKNSAVIWIKFKYDSEKIKTLKSLGGRWSNSVKCWHVPANNHFRKLFEIEIPATGKSVLARLSPFHVEQLNRLKEELQLKAYSQATIKTYLVEFAQLLYLLKDVRVDTLNYQRLRSYILYCINHLGISENQLHSRLNAIKFYYEQVLHKPKFMAEIPRPKKPSTLPKVLSEKEIIRIFDSVKNDKHRLMLELCYGMGLRVSEVVKLKVTDINSNRMQVLVAGAKGKKDRYVPLPASVLELLRQYYRAFKPNVFLFEGQYGGQYSIRSVQSVFRDAMRKARVNKPVGIHGLRHSYATHLLESGTDMVFIQKLLGHQDIKTTQRYAHVGQAQLSAIQSPLDKIRTIKK